MAPMKPMMMTTRTERRMTFRYFTSTVIPRTRGQRALIMRRIQSQTTRFHESHPREFLLYSPSSQPPSGDTSWSASRPSIVQTWNTSKRCSKRFAAGPTNSTPSGGRSSRASSSRKDPPRGRRVFGKRVGRLQSDRALPRLRPPEGRPGPAAHEPARGRVVRPQKLRTDRGRPRPEVRGGQDRGLAVDVAARPDQTPGGCVLRHADRAVGRVPTRGA